jgi:chromosome segregation ATPase
MCEQVKVISEEKATLEENLAATTATAEALSAQLEISMNETIARESTIVHLRAELESKSAELSAVTAEKRIVECSLQSERERSAALETSLNEKQAELCSSQADNEQLAAGKLELEHIIVSKCDEIAQLEASIGGLETELSTLQTEVSTSNETARALEAGVMAKQTELLQLHGEMETLTEQISRLESDKISADATIVALESGLMAKRAELSTLHEEKSRLESQVAVALEAQQQLEMCLADASAKNDDLGDQLELKDDAIASMEGEIEDGLSKLKVSADRIHELESQVAVALEAQQQLEMCLADASAKNDDLGGLLELKDDAIASMEGEIEDGLSKLKVSADRIHELENMSERLTDERDAATVAITELKNEAIDTAAHLEELQSINNDLLSALQCVEQDKNELSKKCNLLTEQLSSSESELEELRSKIEEVSCDVAEAENKFICKCNEVNDAIKKCADLESIIDDQKWCLQKRQVENIELAEKLHSVECELASAQAEFAAEESRKESALANLALAKEEYVLLTSSVEEMKAKGASEIALKDQELENLMETVHTQSDKIEELLNFTSEVQNSLSAMQAERDEVQQKFNSIRLAISAVTTTSTNPYDSSHDGEAFVAESESEISASIQQLRSALDEKKEALESVQDALSATTAAQEVSLKKIKALEKKSDKLQKHIEELESTIDSFNDERISLQEESAELKSQLIAAGEKLDGLQIRLSESLRGTEIAVQQKQGMEKDLEKARANAIRVEQVEEERDELRKQNLEAAEHIITRKRELDTLRQELVKIREQSQGFEAQVAELTKVSCL